MPRRSLCLAVLTVAAFFVLPGEVIIGARLPSTRPEVEDNNSPAAATPLGLIGGYGTATGAIASPGDVDFWSFPAAFFSFVSILCDTGGTQAAGATSRRVTIELIGTTGEVLESDSGDGTGNGGDVTIETTDAAAIAYRLVPMNGTFYIKVSGVTATDVIAPYRLLVAITPWSRKTERAPNPAPSLTTPILDGAAYDVVSGAIDAPGDWDDFSFYTGKPGEREQLFLSLASRSDLVVEVSSESQGLPLLTVDGAETGSSSDPPGESANLILSERSGPTRYIVRVRHATREGTGWYTLMVRLRPSADAVGDFDGDFQVDPAVYSPAGVWTIFHSLHLETSQLSWGQPSLGDVPVPADYDGDGVADAAVYRDPTGEWRLRRANGEETIVRWGEAMAGDVPVPGDYDGDRRYDIATYRRTTGDWFIRFASGSSVTTRWGAPWLDDIPVPADYDGDGATDVAVYRNATGEWFIGYSGGGLGYTGWGAPWLGDIPVPGDYDGNSIADIAVYRKSTASWFIRHMLGSYAWYPWGAAGSADLPVPGDYDGDGRTDVAVYRPQTGAFYIRTTNSPGWLMQPMNGPNHVPVNLSTAVRLLGMP